MINPKNMKQLLQTATSTSTIVDFYTTNATNHATALLTGSFLQNPIKKKLTIDENPLSYYERSFESPIGDYIDEEGIVEITKEENPKLLKHMQEKFSLVIETIKIALGRDAKFCIAGGSVARAYYAHEWEEFEESFWPSEGSDYDIWFSEVQDAIDLCLYFEGILKHKNSKEVKEAKSFESNVYRITDRAHKFCTTIGEIDIINEISHYDIIKHFDLSVSAIAITSDYKLFATEPFGEERVYFQNEIKLGEDCIRSLRRVEKYSRRGFVFDPFDLAEFIEGALSTSHFDTDGISEGSVSGKYGRTICTFEDVQQSIEEALGEV